MSVKIKSFLVNLAASDSMDDFISKAKENFGKKASEEVVDKVSRVLKDRNQTLDETSLINKIKDSFTYVNKSDTGSVRTIEAKLKSWGSDQGEFYVFIKTLSKNLESSSGQTLNTMPPAFFQELFGSHLSITDVISVREALKEDSSKTTPGFLKKILDEEIPLKIYSGAETFSEAFEFIKEHEISKLNLTGLPLTDEDFEKLGSLSFLKKLVIPLDLLNSQRIACLAKSISLISLSFKEENSGFEEAQAVAEKMSKLISLQQDLR